MIRFTDPNRRLPNEKRSKLLDPCSPLYQKLENYRKSLLQAYSAQIAGKRMDFHLELLQPGDPAEDGSLLVERARELEGQEIRHWNPECYGKAVVINGPYLEGYGNTHITVAYFPKGIPDTFYCHSSDE
jgi:hypothetical protein